MQGAHDLGGKHGLGPIDPEPENDEPVFHADWERRAFALTMAAGMLGEWNIDESRYARERQHPIAYLSQSYYENWVAGVSKLLVEKGLVSAAEMNEPGLIDDRSAVTNLRVPTPEDAEKILTSGGPALLKSAREPVFAPGDRVRVRKNHSTGHTRAPAYVQGSVGTIVQQYGCHVFPDTHARQQDGGEHLYSVCFSAESLWGSNDDNSEVLIDLWEPYLEAAL